ncbi:LexA/Signal peptidase [Punctularia strigosozonata HHB-11173 SS5]|uniref:LexA/Signal peptidase n=1 Tax=Punctularia strigosozonata (strain HHB-11173) TaxID=741275 RepID=UPI00044164D6|nr:LexA/Signal peptidase [Punctularia strigosozonata HHB-11173 SS5]EIN13538.1 LexA/Signal peptidase [Punctularia strigosozonata HHB-11173 SS5]
MLGRYFRLCLANAATTIRDAPARICRFPGTVRTAACDVVTAIRNDPTGSAKIGAYYAAHTFNAVCAVHLFCEYVGGPKLSTGPSMLPTLANEGELVLENCLSYRLNPACIKRGTLVTFTSPLDPTRIVCKRVLGLPGDIVCVDPTGLKAPSTEHVVVPRGHLWVIGDNASWSRDSRDYGPLTMALLRGTVVAKVGISCTFRWIDVMG